MAEIFLAIQRGAGSFRKLVVLKQILPEARESEDAVAMFLKEAEVTAGFSHPNIAQVYDFDRHGDDLFLVMEFVPGATLSEVRRACETAGQPFPLGLALRVGF